MNGIKSVLTPKGQTMPLSKASMEADMSVLTPNHLLKIKGGDTPIPPPPPPPGIIEDEVECP
jgi:hypothetical protein